MSEIQEFKCPSCGGAINFDTKSQKMKCPYCNSEFDINNLQSYDEILNCEVKDDTFWNSSTTNSWKSDEASGLKTYICNSCGGEIICDENTAAKSCPFCDNPIVVTEQFVGNLKPDYIIPFKLDKNDAKNALKNHYGNKKLLPRIFKDKNHIDEIKGIYVPFWLCDAEVYANIHYKGTKTKKWSDTKYNYTETRFYSILRGGNLVFQKIPVNASTTMSNNLMESLEPFDFKNLVDFKTLFLAGYLADKYDIDSNECSTRANVRIKKSTEEVFSKTVENYASLTIESSNLNFKNGYRKYALLPVWLLNTTWNGEKYVFAMNGQTGKFIGDLPMDRVLYKRWLIGLFLSISSILFAVFYFVWFIK